MPRRRNRYLEAILKDDPEYHLALLAIADAPKVKKPPVLTERNKLQIKYRMSADSKQCRFKHVAWKFRWRLPKKAGGGWYCEFCVKSKERKQARLAIEKAKAEAEGRIWVPPVRKRNVKEA